MYLWYSQNIRMPLHQSTSVYICRSLFYLIFCFVLEEGTVSYTCLILVELTGT